MMKIQEANQSGEADPERQKRAMADPEIQAILGDPQMRSILQVTPALPLPLPQRLSLTLA